MFKIEFSSDSDSFQQWGEDLELNQIFARIREERRLGYLRDGAIIDANGNSIGRWEYVEEE